MKNAGGFFFFFACFVISVFQTPLCHLLSGTGRQKGSPKVPVLLLAQVLAKLELSAAFPGSEWQTALLRGAANLYELSGQSNSTSGKQKAWCPLGEHELLCNL